MLERPTQATIPGDLAAGLTVAALVVPLSVALAVTAGLPPERGLAASVLPLVAFALLASSRHTMIGPDASVTALIVAAVVPLAASTGGSVGDLAAAVAIVAGATCLLAALVGIGRLAGVLESSALVGYLAGLALVVGVSQLPRILGLAFEADEPIGQLLEAARRLDDAHVASALLGIGTAVAIIVAGRVRPHAPWLFLAVAAATVVSEVGGLPARGVATVGELPRGLPMPSIPTFDPDVLIRLLPAALAIAAATFADTLATSRAFADRHGDSHSPGRDLAALGAADVVAGIAGGMPVSASGARTAAAEAAGGHSQLAGIVAAAIVAAAVLLGGGLLEVLPLPALGGVVIAAVVPMVDVQALGRLRRLENVHFRQALLVAAVVVVVGVLEGIVAALVVSLLDHRLARRRAAGQARDFPQPSAHDR